MNIYSRPDATLLTWAISRYSPKVVGEGQHEYLLESGYHLPSFPRVRLDRPPLRPLYHLALPGEDWTLCGNRRTAYVSVQRDDLEQMDLCVRCDGRS